MEKENALSESNLSVPPSLINQRQYVPWGMLFFRMISFAIFQSIIACGFLLKNISNPWEQSLAWWPFSVSLTNLLCIGFLIRNARKENRKFLDQFRIHRETLKKDLVTIIGVLFISIILVMGPNIGLAIALLNDPQAGLKLMDYPLPIWAVILSFLLLPTTQLFAEIPMYFTYIRPKLQQQGSQTLGSYHSCSDVLIFSTSFDAFNLKSSGNSLQNVHVSFFCFISRHTPLPSPSIPSLYCDHACLIRHTTSTYECALSSMIYFF